MKRKHYLIFSRHNSAVILIVALRLLSHCVPNKQKSSVRISSSILGQRSHSDSTFFNDKEVSRPVFLLGERLDDMAADVFRKLHSLAKQNDTTACEQAPSKCKFTKKRKLRIDARLSLGWWTLSRTGTVLKNGF